MTEPSAGFGVYQRDPEDRPLDVPPRRPRPIAVVATVAVLLALVIAAILCFCLPVQPASTSAAAWPVTRVAP